MTQCTYSRSFYLIPIALGLVLGPTARAAVPAVSTPAENYAVGITAGLAFLSQGGGSHANIGVVGDYRFAPDWMAGLFYNYIGRGTIQGGTPGTSTSASLNFVGLEGAYILTDWLPGLQVGAKIAVGWNNVSTSVSGGGSVDTSTTDFYYGPKVAFDAAIGGGFSVGADVNWLFTGGGNPNSFNVLAVGKYWF